jgi:tetratricopeptide (TPR) repeat protein
MELYAGSGQRSMALRQYRTCVKVLEQELGVPPLEETTALYEAIQAGELLRREAPAAPAPSKPQLAHPLPPLPLVGRQQELERLSENLAAVGEVARLVILVGESGVGKTRLADEFLGTLRKSRTSVLQSRSYPGEAQLPYAPVVDALRQGLRQGLIGRLQGLDSIWLSEASRLLPELKSSFPGLPEPAALSDISEKSRLFEGLHQVTLRLLGGRGPGALFLDDFHNADSSTREWLGYVLRRGRAGPLLLLTAWRADGPQDLQSLHAWSDGLPTERKHELILARLSREHLRDLLRRHLRGAQVPAEQVEALYRETEGLPLLLAESLKPAEEGTEAAAIPRPRLDVFARRVSAVGEAARQLLAAGAVIGHRFGLDSVRQVSGRSEEEVVSGLEQLLTAGLISEQPAADPKLGPAYDFTHSRLRQATLQGLTQVRARLLHRRAAEALLSQEGKGELAAQIARHLAAAGLEAEAAEQYQRAAEHARGLHANREALDHYASALALGHAQPGLIHEGLGDLLTLQGDYREAVRHYEAALAFQPGQPLGGLERKVANVFQRWGQWEQAEAHYSSALSSWGESDRSELARLYADWSLAAHRQGDPEAARQLLAKGLRAAEAAQDELALAQCTNMLGVLDRAGGAPQQAEQHLRRSLAIARRLQDPGAQIAALNNLALALADRGDLESAQACASEALALCVTIGDRHRQAALHSNLADLLHRAGQPEQAQEQLKRSAALFTEVGLQEGEYLPEIWKLVEW